MNGDAIIRTAIERSAKAVSLKPSVGQGTAITKVRLRPGLACDVEEGDWKFVVGMSPKYGGSNEGPNPGIFGRAALGSCLAICYGMWSARLDVPFESVEVDVFADYDVRGELAVSGDVRPAYSAIRYAVRVESSAPEEDVLRVLDTADRYSSYVDLYAHGVPLKRDVQISSPAVR